MNPVIEVEVVFPCRKQFQARGEVAGIDQLVLERAPQPSMKTLSSARPRPSIMIAMPRLLSGAKKSAEVNCEP